LWHKPDIKDGNHNTEDLPKTEENIPSLEQSSSFNQDVFQKKLATLQEQVEQIEEMKAQIEFLSRSLLHSPHLFQVSQPESSSSILFQQTQEVSSAPPPPPPPPNGTQLFNNGTVAIGSVPLKRPERKPKTREQLHKELCVIIDESDIISINKPKAVSNFMNAFSEKHLGILERIIAHYHFLIRKMPLKPKTIYEKFQIWETEIFQKLPENQARTLREKKQFEIEKLSGEELKQQLEWIWKSIENKKKEEEEKKKAKESQQVVGSMISELKDVLKKDEIKTQIAQAQQELEAMEPGELISID